MPIPDIQSGAESVRLSLIRTRVPIGWTPFLIVRETCDFNGESHGVLH